jgi:hypothetical protein
VDESVDDVVDRQQRFVVVKKVPGEPAEIARKFDPRS